MKQRLVSFTSEMVQIVFLQMFVVQKRLTNFSAVFIAQSNETFQDFFFF